MKRILILLALLLAGTAAAQTVFPDSTLRTLANARGIRIGAAVTFPSNATERASYETVLAKEFNAVVCENAMKYGSIEPQNGNFTYTQADAIVAFAEAHNMAIRGHNLLWYQQSGYLANLNPANVSRDSFFVLLKRHVNNVVGRYKGKIYEWDVVNEAIDENQSDGHRKAASGNANLWALAGNKADYIDSMFVWAHRADSSALLIYNDYNVEGGNGSTGGGANTAKSNFMFALAAGLKSRGIPIHGVGFQSHLTTFDTAAIAANMRRYDSIGLNVSITESDVSISSATDTAQLNKQKREFKKLLAVCLRQPNCKTFMAWGVHDARSWHSNQYPLLFTGTTTITKKAAYYGVQEALLEATPVALRAPARVPGVARPSVGVFDGRVLLFGEKGRLFDLQGRRVPAVPLR